MSDLFFRQLVHLLPDGAAFRVTIDKTLRRFFQGVSKAPALTREYIDRVFDDAFPTTTREVVMWEEQFGLAPPTTEAAARLRLAAAWSAQGGQSPSYLQTTVRAAGFDVYLHEWWLTPPSTPPVARDPRDYTDDPLIGTVQCGEPLALCGEPYQQCNDFLVNETGYLVNRDLTLRAPPPVPADSATWPYFLYWGPATLTVGGPRAQVPAARRDEFETLLLKLCPEQQWLVTYVEYT